MNTELNRIQDNLVKLKYGMEEDLEKYEDIYSILEDIIYLLDDLIDEIRGG